MKPIDSRLLATVAVVVLSLTPASYAATLATWSTQGASGTAGSEPVSIAPTTATGITGASLVRGPGLDTANLANGFSADDWNSAIGTITTAVSQQDYFQWGLTVDPGNVASLASIDFSLRRSAVNAPQAFQIQASLDNFATTPIVVRDFFYRGRSSGTAPGTVTQFQWETVDTPGQGDGNLISPTDLSSIAPLQNIPGGTTVTFRLYGWVTTSGAAASNTVALGRANATNGAGGPVIQGTVVAIPEPASCVLAIGGLVAGLMAMRRVS